MSKHVAIVGAGIMGLLTAREFLALGWRVTVFEKQTEEHYGGNTSFAAGGMLAPHSELESADLLVHRLGQASLHLWPDIVRSLPDRIFFRQKGSLIVSHQRDRPFFDQLTARILNQVGLDEARFVPVGSVEPELGDLFEQGLYLPNEAHVDNRELLPSLVRDLGRRQAKILFGEDVRELEPYVVSSGKGRMLFDLVVDCRGIGALSVLPDLRGVRGEAFILQTPHVRLERPIRLMHPRYAVYVVPRGQSRFYVGATSIESAENAKVTVRSTLELLSAAYSVHRGFGEATIVEALHGIRPAFPSNAPQIQFEAGRIRINGLYRHGFLLSPVLARSLSLFLQDKPVPFGEQIFTFA